MKDITKSQWELVERFVQTSGQFFTVEVETNGRGIYRVSCEGKKSKQFRGFTTKINALNYAREMEK